MKKNYLYNKLIKTISLILFILGITLLIINIIGVFIPLKNQAIYKQKTGFKKDITLTTKEAFNIINQSKTNKKAYIYKVNNAINKSILHYWTGKHEKDYNIILPFYENYILYILTHTFYRKSALHYEFCNYKKTIARGVGLCSQSSTALADILNKKGIHANIITWPQHTVTEVEIKPNIWWIADPDYGVIMEHSMKDINTNPSIIESYYLKAGYSKSTVQNLILVFSSNKKKVFWYNGPGYANCNGIRGKVEYWSYIFIWIIPIVLVLPYSLIKIREKYAK